MGTALGTLSTVSAPDDEWDDSTARPDLTRSVSVTAQPQPVAPSAIDSVPDHQEVLTSDIHLRSLSGAETGSKEFVTLSSFGDEVLTRPEPSPFRTTSLLRVDKTGGCTFVNQYAIVKFLGQGACGRVFLCFSITDSLLYAMKCVRRTELQTEQRSRLALEDLRGEIAIMGQMQHPNVVGLREIIDDPSDGQVLLVMEYVEGGPVLSREALAKRRRIPESRARLYVIDMVLSLQYLHAHKVVHGDLKPENVLLSASGRVKLSDFGCSKVFQTGNEYLERCNGTPAFLAPEMLQPMPRYRGRPVDVYALGACIYTFVYGRIPFTAGNLYKLFQIVKTQPVQFPTDVVVSDDLVDLMRGTFAKDPKQRLTLPQVMAHPWLRMSATASLPRSPSSDPRSVDYLLGLVNRSRSRCVFQAGDYLMRQGQAGSYMLYITSGWVDVVIKVPPHSSREGPKQGARGGKQAAVGEAEGLEKAVEDEGCVREDAAMLRMRGKLADAAHKASCFLQRTQLGRNRFHVAQRGPGEFVGEASLLTRAAMHNASVHASTEVQCHLITRSLLQEYIAANPECKHQLSQIMHYRESESMIIELLVRLSQAQRALETKLREAELAVARHDVDAGGSAEHLGSPPRGEAP